MPTIYQHLRGRADFQPLLGRLIDQTGALRLEQGSWAVLESVRAQLEAVRGWTADGRDPLPEERARFTVGRLALREIEPSAPPDVAAYAAALVELDDYLERWPTHAALDAFDDDDLLSDFADG